MTLPAGILRSMKKVRSSLLNNPKQRKGAKVPTLSDIVMIGYVRQDSTIQDKDSGETWPDVGTWNQERIRRQMPGTLFFDAPDSGQK